ncbi:DNA recombination/repair protein RecA, partial [Rhodospirillaceae bacterium]|nr:DNA recombination/repair protein RecA [Rhodospirillaceae bacterium]
ERIGQGRENAKKFLAENSSVAIAIENAVRENAGLVAEAMLVGPETEDDIDENLD